MRKWILSVILVLIPTVFHLEIIPGIVSDNSSDTTGRFNPDESTVLLEELMSIGILEGNSQYMFHNPNAVAVDSQGNIYVLDAGNFRIQKFDENGKYLLSIGRKGQGPGEFLECFDFDLDSQENIILFDFLNKRVSQFSSDGKYIDSIKIRFPARLGTVSSDDSIYLYERYNGKLIHKYDSNGEYCISFMDEIKFEPKRIEPHINGLGQISAFEDKIYLAMINPYAIHVFDQNGKRLDRIELEVSHSKIPYITPDNMVFTRFLFNGLSISPEGFIFNKGISFDVPKDWQNKFQEIFQNLYDHSFIDIIDSKGNFIEHLKCPGFTWGGTFDSQGYYYAIKEEEAGFHKVVKYAVNINSVE